jgi:gamma-glutamyltranspeptidase/glutathione hydrolase
MKHSLTLCLVILLAFVAWAGSQEKGLLDRVAPFKSFGHAYEDGSFESMRPRIMGTHGVISTGHYLSTLAGMEVLRNGGNAHDAGVAAAMALKVMKMGYAGWTGVAPLILYSANEDRVITRVGAGTTPAKATLEHYLERGKTDINMAILPADVDVWLATLDRFGTLSFKEASRATIEIAEGGYHLYKHQKSLLDHLKEGILRFRYNTEFWYQHGVDNQQLGDLMVNKDLGKLVRYMVDAEAKTLASGGSRSDGIRAARDAFYKGEPAQAVGEFYEQFEDGLVTYEDMANYQGKWMEPLHTKFRGYDVYVCDGWSQGPRMILFLNMLENFDIDSLGYNTPAYIHLLSQIINLGMSDSYKYIGDPDVVDTPAALYTKQYARKRAQLIDMKKAFRDMPPWGDPEKMLNVATDSPTVFARRGDVGGPESRVADMDTTSLNVMDGEGSVVTLGFRRAAWRIWTPRP